jgi:hypothetical protein
LLSNFHHFLVSQFFFFCYKVSSQCSGD